MKDMIETTRTASERKGTVGYFAGSSSTPAVLGVLGVLAAHFRF
jgi:hypothetical protein